MTPQQPSTAPTLPDRLAGMMWAPLVSDAYCLGSHWIYGAEDFSKAFPEGAKGFDAPAPGHYHEAKSPGDMTHYGDAGLVLLESVAAAGELDPRHYGERFAALMEDDAYNGYRDHATKDTLANARRFKEAHPDRPFDWQQGADDDQNVTTSRLAPVVARHAHGPDLIDRVERAVRVCQNNDRAVAYACLHALMLQDVLAGVTLREALATQHDRLDRRTAFGAELAGSIDQVLASLGEATGPVAERFGLSCPLVKALPAALHIALTHEQDLPAAIHASAEARGDNASRNGLIGAWLGAMHGLDAVPEAWRKRMNAGERIAKAVDAVIQARAVRRTAEPVLH
ncbi:MAG: ADP-ribosylglycohydrolase family protein [Geminicoccaceae bacterium]